MKRTQLIILVVIILIVGGAIWLSQRNKSPFQAQTETTEITKTPTPLNQTAVVTIGKKQFEVEVADDPTEQSQGLSGRDSLAANAGMLFVFEPASQPNFWMKDMKLPLDIVWVYQGKVVHISRNLPVPAAGTVSATLPTYSAGQVVDNVIEINAGQADALKVGDEVVIGQTSSL